MDLAELSDEDLVESVLTWAARVARGEARLLALVAELDRRETWAEHGVSSCAAWLSWKLGWAMGTAWERVRVARALRDLPLLRAELEAGHLSYCKARAVTRVATAQDEARWLQLARASTGAQLDEACRGAERARAADRDPAEQQPKQQVRLDWDDDGDLLLTLRIPAHQAPGVLAALEQHQAAEQTEREELLQELLTEALGAPADSSADDCSSHDCSSHDCSARDSSAEEQLTLPEPRTPADEMLQTAVDGPAVDGPATQQPWWATVDLSEVPGARWLSPLEHVTYVEPPCPLGPNAWGRDWSEADQQAMAAWEAQCRQARTACNAWNERREHLLVEAAAQRLPTGKATLADALVRLVTRGVDCAPVTLQLLVDPLSSWARTGRDLLLPPPAVDKVLRELPLHRGALPAELCQYDQGRDSRLISPRQRRLLGQLDGERCRFPGCRHTKRLHAHHLQFFKDGGRTDLANMILLCSKHHRLLHHQGYTLTLDPDRTLHVHTPDGTRLEHRPTLPDSPAEELPDADPLSTDHHGDTFDRGYLVNVMLSHAA